MTRSRSCVLSVGSLALAASSFAFAAPVAAPELEGLDAQLVMSVTMDLMGSWTSNPREAISVYDNTSAPQAAGVYLNGGAVAGITNLVADDTTPTASGVLDEFSFGVANTDPSAAFSARPRIRIWAADGVGGAPGTLLGGFTFNPITFAANSLNLYTTGTGLASSNLVLPAGSIWWGLTFDNVGATATNAQLNLLGQILIDPPSIGSSNGALSWESSGPGSWFVSNPTGSNINAAPVSNIAWEYSLVPEPAALSLLGLGGLMVLARRRA